MSTFIVRFPGDPSDEFRGRVRHVSSGEEICFASIAELLSFFEGMSVVGSPAAADGKPVESERTAE